MTARLPWFTVIESPITESSSLKVFTKHHVIRRGYEGLRDQWRDVFNTARSDLDLLTIYQLEMIRAAGITGGMALKVIWQ